MVASPIPTELARAQGHWLTLLVGVTLVPHLPYLPLWLSAICVLLAVWRVACDLGKAPLPPRGLLLLIVLAIVAGTGLHYRYLLGKDPGLALLAALACLKLLESRKVRDGRALVLLGFFLQTGQFLNNQEIPVAVITLAGCLVALATLMVLQHEAPLRATLMRAGALLLQAAPVMLALFVVFPRLSGPLWGLPADAYSGRNGLSDSMSPGSISQLIQSGAIAFRAHFDGPVPPPRLRYWRGPVFSDFDGSAWRAGESTVAEAPRYVAAGPAYAYRITLEAHGRHWLLALDYPAGPVPGVSFSSDLDALLTEPVNTRRQLQLSSFPETPAGVREPGYRLARNLRLPERSNPRLQQLGLRLRQRLGDPSARVDALIEAFRAQQLSYTLRPAPLGGDAADQFFFDTREGFCEHFSSAFAIASRAAGLPARVVTGYQGGELNPLDDSLVIRQSDAHAWVEVWLEGRGWLRIDPTAESNPIRIDVGIAEALPDSDALPLFMQPHMGWLRGMRIRWEALSNRWNQWVLGYNREHQQNLLEEFGLRGFDASALAIACVVLVGLLMLAYLAWALRSGRRRDRLDRLWTRFCMKLARAGTPRPRWQGPMDFAREAALRHPALASEIREIASRYAMLRYGPQRSDRSALNELAGRIGRIRPR